MKMRKYHCGIVLLYVILNFLIFSDKTNDSGKRINFSVAGIKNLVNFQMKNKETITGYLLYLNIEQIIKQEPSSSQMESIKSFKTLFEHAPLT
jgi:hypothetical protein